MAEGAALQASSRCVSPSSQGVASYLTWLLVSKSDGCCLFNEFKAPTNRSKTHQNANLSHVFMQQAETVRLITSESAAISITELKQGDLVLGWEGHDARHVGLPVDGGIEER